MSLDVLDDEKRALAKKLRAETNLGIMDVVNALRATNWSEQDARKRIQEHASLISI